MHDLATALVHSVRSGDVRTTVVDGRVLMRDRRLLTLDVPAITAEIRGRLPAPIDRGRGDRVQHYDG